MFNIWGGISRAEIYIFGSVRKTDKARPLPVVARCSMILLLLFLFQACSHSPNVIITTDPQRGTIYYDSLGLNYFYSTQAHISNMSKNPIVVQLGFTASDFDSVPSAFVKLQAFILSDSLPVEGYHEFGTGHLSRRALNTLKAESQHPFQLVKIIAPGQKQSLNFGVLIKPKAQAASVLAVHPELQMDKQSKHGELEVSLLKFSIGQYARPKACGKIFVVQ